MENSGYQGSRICDASFFVSFLYFLNFLQRTAFPADPKGPSPGRRPRRGRRGAGGSGCPRLPGSALRSRGRRPGADPLAVASSRGPGSPRPRGAGSPSARPRGSPSFSISRGSTASVLNFPLGGAQGPLGGAKWPQPLPRVSLRPPPGTRSASGVYTGSAAAGPVPGAASPQAGGSQKRGAAGARGRQGPEKSGRRRGEDRGRLLTKKKLNHQRNH